MLQLTVVFRSVDRIEGIKVKTRDVWGYIVGTIEAVHPFQGLCDSHLYMWDASIDDTVSVLPDIVTRHYGECVVWCDTSELLVEYQSMLNGAIRTYVVLASEEQARWDAFRDAELLKDGCEKRQPYPMRPSREELDAVLDANQALSESLRKYYTNRNYEFGIRLDPPRCPDAVL